ncbi:RnfABCDGE type electron transport complex subunit G [Herbivorax sp. ANBcel31]|uniref:RnfABCDGE type electron transport complex subunit G n=1 Tax=Herbivorax sp. ANBcel31 TaxID=3069754 RepID=UPI0027B41E53|nr:RnfABCDGE type electron transport complex subunit G [Herbivorax sp. ANBcel31]MDQ2086561.1 RnfABCDGE type electron transport complex subunit G [Herbivorax sp. ANBcel31]
MRDIIKAGLILCVISFIVTLALAFTHWATEDIIEERRLEKEREAREQVMSFVDSFEELNGVECSLDMVKGVYNGISDGDVVGRVFMVEGRGYGGPINMTVGIDNNGKITGVNIIDNQETPGLGTKIAEEDFLIQFAGIKPEQPLMAVKNPPDNDEEIDVASGATVSSEAVVDAVQAAIDVNKEIINSKGAL